MSDYIFAVPTDYSKPIYLRVHDPDTGGTMDEEKGDWDTNMMYSIFGGKGACSNKDAQQVNTKGNYDSGTLLATKTFGEDDQLDGKWYAFGPINPSEGEFLPDYGGYIFKFMAEGISGDDGNLYHLYLSSEADRNINVEGAFAFYFKYKFRMHDNQNEVSHIYPFIDDRVVSIKQTNFDWDNDGIIRIISIAKNGELMSVSEDDDWARSTHKITKEEKNTSLDIQMIKDRVNYVKNNNVVIYLENQYGELLPFYSVPIGGIPKYKYSIGLKPQKRNN